MVVANLLAQLKQEEGFSATPYKDTRGFLTIGYGFNLAAGIDSAIADFLLIYKIQQTITALNTQVSWWAQLDNVRAQALADLAFNMGVATLLTFVKFLAALKASNFDAAADELINSDWYKQVGTRGPRIVNMIKTGTV